MAKTRPQILAAAERWLQDAGGKIDHGSAADLGSAVDRALEEYSRLRPRERYVLLDGDGSTFEWVASTSLTGWVDRWSRLLRVEHPFPPASGQRERNVLLDASDPDRPERVQVLHDEGGLEVVTFLEGPPASGTGNVLVRYTAPHVIHASDPGNTTILAPDVEAFCVLVAAYGHEMLAAYYEQTNDAQLAVDVVDWRSKGGAFAARAGQLRARFERHMGLVDGVQAASSCADWDTYLRGGRDRIFHGARGR